MGPVLQKFKTPCQENRSKILPNQEFTHRVFSDVNAFNFMGNAILVDVNLFPILDYAKYL